MLGLEDLEIGLMFWARKDALETVQEAKSFGVRAGQLGFPGDLNLDGAAEKWDRALTDEEFTLTTVFCSYVGEQYKDIPTVEATVGLVPEATRNERIARTKAVSDVAKDLGVDALACHIGFVPEDVSAPLYSEIRDVVREMCDHCAKNGQRFAMETGQEPAKVMQQFIHNVGRDNLKVNFDPANMILYGTGEPVEALGVLAPYVISVHCKDGDWPDRSNPESLGEERPLGDGAVGIDRFVHRLKELDYRGVLTIEREEQNPEKRAKDIRNAIKLLRWITGRD